MAQLRNAGFVSVAVDPVALVVQECITVTSAMRKHARWAQSSVTAILGGGPSSGVADTRSRAGLRSRPPEAKESNHNDRLSTSSLSDDPGLANRWGLRGKKGQSMQDNPLLSAFARLRSDLKSCKGETLCISLQTEPRLTMHRYPHCRCSINTPPVPPGHPIFFHFCTHNLPRPYSDHKVLRLQYN